MLNLFNMLNYFSSTLSGAIILFLLAIDTIRSVIAFLGFVKPTSKFARFIYGQNTVNLVAKALEEIGFNSGHRKTIITKMKEVAKQSSEATGVTSENAPIWLILLLSKYIVKFNSEITYGGNSTTKSKYYIDTMEISHNQEDIHRLSAIMIQLIFKVLSEKPDVIITPKGGNPLFAQAVVQSMGDSTTLIMKKPSNDKSLINASNLEYLFKINYEGSWDVLDNPQKIFKNILVDCNTSGGSQLIEIVENINDLRNKMNVNLSKPENAFVLFRADTKKRDIDKKFEDCDTKLIRYFDLDENIKKMLFELHEKIQTDHHEPDCYIESDKKEAQKIIDKMKDNKTYYYDKYDKA